ncbi:hypothetical protein AGDE_05649 [Angomonas deanei]|nr:hypothetical protein AGDE_05966 [Angomonas deanei]EPY38280.1 hypothetical protein AGDE_05649 [Angomonas deanei]|eukprot:EPY37967.1 hypothetical protein AGDE_05966 [Angomonas deanei]
MQSIAKLPAQVMSLSGSRVEETLFASLPESGMMSLWDTRTSGAVFTATAQAFSTDCGSEILLVDHHQRVVTLCGNRAQFIDIRQSNKILSEYIHSSELVCFNSAPVLESDGHILAVDEDGRILSLSLSTGEPTGEVDGSVFGQPVSVGTTGFGQLDNYCCGLGPVSSPQGVRLLLALGMSGTGVVYSSPFEATTLQLEEDNTNSSNMVVNPPLPTCCAFEEGKVAVGKANGMYDILFCEEDGTMETVMSAPGDAANGIVYVDWSPVGLLTVSLCGEITAWDVEEFLDEDPLTQDEGRLPRVSGALSHRGTTGSGRAVVNCASRLGPSAVYVLADTEGNIATFNLFA